MDLVAVVKYFRGGEREFERDKMRMRYLRLANFLSSEAVMAVAEEGMGYNSHFSVPLRGILGSRSRIFCCIVGIAAEVEHAGRLIAVGHKVLAEHCQCRSSLHRQRH